MDTGPLVVVAASAVVILFNVVSYYLHTLTGIEARAHPDEKKYLDLDLALAAYIAASEDI